MARLGGDEFVAVLPDPPDERDLQRLITRLQTELAKIPVPELPDIEISASIGVAFYRGTENPESLLEAADQAMYVVKRSRRPASRSILETVG